MKNQNRFVPIKELQELYKQKEEIINKINSYDINHCKICGDTKPEHGFQSLFTSTLGLLYTSSLTCNKCARTKEEYENLFLNKKND